MTTLTQSRPSPSAPSPGKGFRVVSLRRKLTNHVMTVVVTLAFLIALVPLISLLWTSLANGLAAMSWDFLTTDMSGVFGSMTTGGVQHAIIGTLLITLTAGIISVPVGLMAAVYLVEYGGKGRLARALTFFVDVMTGIPSIVAGLFAFTLFTQFDPSYRSGLMGAVALSVLMIPVVVRSVEEMLRLVPNELREASYALGVPKWRTIVKIVLRTSLPGIVTGVMLAIARVIGETAPLLLTVGMITTVNTDVFEGRMATLPVFAYQQWKEGTDAGLARAWGAALTLIFIVMALNLIARLISRRYSTAAR